MGHGIAVSKKGFDVIEPLTKKTNSKNELVTRHILWVLAMPYILGTKKQIERYLDSASKLQTEKTNAILDCMHEASNLFEDLCTVSKYANKCGATHDLDRLILDIRNHIRHDLRENFDEESHDGRKSRLKRLGIKPHLQTSIEFDTNAIKVGDKNITIQEMISYLEWSESILRDVLDEAEKNGYISSSK